MKTIILAGGFGTRISEESSSRPKPMIEIGGMPLIWHIMKLYSEHGLNDFVILLGYKGYIIKEYFSNYFLHQSDITIDMATNEMQVHNNSAEPWRVTLLDTGAHSMTGGRIKRAAKHINGEPFLLTYGDGVADVNISETIEFHKKQNKLVTMTSVQPAGRFGALNIDANNSVASFIEKPTGDGNWINGGFFVCEPGVIDYIDGDKTVFEQEPLEKLAQDGQLVTYKHKGFWQCMDTLRDKRFLEELWESDSAPWKIWAHN